MSYSPAHKERTRRRILESARRFLKEQGLGGVSVDSLMAGAGLTRGGFYAHFSSKDELVAAALDDTVLLGFLQKHKSGGTPEPVHWTRAVLEEYLGPLHRDQPATGCPLAIHVGEITLAAPQARAVYTNLVKEVATELAGRLPRNAQKTSSEALAILALIVGGMALARGVNDTELSDAILAACREAISDL
jgi:AcrR family transcriptional regulator